VQETLRPLSAWESYYVILGSSGAALTGLQFVVITLGAEGNVVASSSATSAFSTPTIVHFCAVLLVAAILSAPWHALSSAALALGAAGIAGVAYTLRVIRHARRQKDYAPVFEDWLWYAVLPLVAYAALLSAAVALARHPHPSLFVVGAAALLLMYVGIHNAWDTVTYIATGQAGQRPRQERAEAEDDQQQQQQQPAATTSADAGA
jgi:hypothetical protein